MKIFLQKHKLEVGQVIPLVVLMLFVIIGMAALILDGGAIMSNRRTAQAAADSSALAGAQRLCSNEPDAYAVAFNYATNNNAEPDSITVDTPNRIVSVKTRVQHPSFFAGIFGEDTLAATAQATAGCFYPSVGKRVLPIAFYYESPPVKAHEAKCDDITKPCNIVNWDFDELMALLKSTPITNQPLEAIYVIADSAKVCQKNVSGEIVCYEMAKNPDGGNRTWIELGELNLTNKNLKEVIKSGIDKPIETKAWIPGKSGLVAAVFNADNYSQLEVYDGIGNLPYRLVMVPVFDLFCSGDPRHNDCGAEPDDNYYLPKNPNNDNHYRLVSFAPFLVTCVTKGGDCEFGVCTQVGNKAKCPGYMVSNPSGQVAIEGYFVSGIPIDKWVSGTGGVDLGYYLISLTE
jgi:hypothetical protein